MGLDVNGVELLLGFGRGLGVDGGPLAVDRDLGYPPPITTLEDRACPAWSLRQRYTSRVRGKLHQKVSGQQKRRCCLGRA